MPFPEVARARCECGCGFDGIDPVTQWLIEEAVFGLVDYEDQRARAGVDALADLSLDGLGATGPPVNPALEQARAFARGEVT